MAAASDNLTLEETQNLHNQSPLHLDIKESPEDVLFSQRQPELNASVSSQNRVLEQSATDSKGHQSKVPQLDAIDKRRISHVLSLHKHKEPQNNQDMQSCKDPPAQYLDCQPTPPKPGAISKVPQFGLLEARAKVGSGNVRRNHKNGCKVISEVNCDVGETKAKNRLSKLPKFEGWETCRAEPNYAEGFTGVFYKTREERHKPLSNNHQLSNCARCPLLDEQFLNQRTLCQQFAEDSGGGGRVIHGQRGRKGKDVSQDEKTTWSLPASSPVPKTSLPNHKELNHFKVNSINNTQEVKKSRCFPWFRRG